MRVSVVGHKLGECLSVCLLESHFRDTITKPISTQILMAKTLEAKKDEQEQQQEEKALAIWDLGSPLYDSYELVALTHLIERHLMTLPSLGGSKRLLSNKISPASDRDRDLVVIPAAIFVSNMGSKREIKRVRSSSILNTLSEFVRRKLWIKRKIGSYNRKDKSRKLKAAGHCCVRFGL